MASNKKIIISMSIIGLLLVSLAISYAYFSAKITNNESESTIVATAAYLELTFIDGSPEINASNILPGWSASKTFSVQNTGDSTAYYVLKITDINNPFVYGGISYKIESSDGGANVDLDTLPLANMPVSGPIEIPVNTTHNYTITTYYNELEESQLSDLGKSFSYTVSIEAVYKKDIQYIEDLVDLSNEVNSGTSYEHTWFVLTRDLDFNSDESYKNANNTTTYGDYNGNGTVESIKTELTTGSGFKPIGNKSANRFYGSLDGYNHRLNNIYINTNNGNIRVGLFGWTNNNATLRNFTLSGNITHNANNYTGGISGSLTNTTVFNVHNEVNVNKSVSSSGVGGLSGIIYNVYIKNCSNKGKIQGGEGTGGIIGMHYANSTNTSTLFIENSHNEGIITNSNGLYVGGIIALDNSTLAITKIYNSHNMGNVTNNADDTSSRYIGGLIGRARGNISIEKSFNTGGVSWSWDYANNTNTTEYVSQIVGGLVGTASNGSISNSYNTGNISSGSWVGGLIGSKGTVDTTFIINKSYNIGTIETKYKNAQAATAPAGLVGYNTHGNLYILNSYNGGEIISTTDSGGIVGKNQGYIIILNSYNGSAIRVTSGSYYVGGIVGISSGSSEGLVTNNVYNIGTITSGNSNYTYGITAINSGTYTINNSYHLNTINGTRVGNLGTPLTSEYMSSPEFVNLLNQNKRNINLSSINASLASYELSDWKYDAEKGYPILDN